MTDVKEYLTWLAVKRDVSAATQNQAFNALLFFFRHVLGREFGKVDGVVGAKRRPFIPTVPSRAEIEAALSSLEAIGIGKICSHTAFHMAIGFAMDKGIERSGSRSPKRGGRGTAEAAHLRKPIPAPPIPNVFLPLRCPHSAFGDKISIVRFRAVPFVESFARPRAGRRS